MTIVINSSNSFSSGTASFTLRSSDTLNVEQFGFIVSEGADALVLDGINQTYTVSVAGTVASQAAGGAGIALRGMGNGADISVAWGGLVYGQAIGVRLDGLSFVTNRGTIESRDNAAIYTGDTYADYAVYNQGDITSRTGPGILFNGGGVHRVTNIGHITSNGHSFSIQSLSEWGIDYIVNSGLLTGNVYLGGGADTIVSRGRIDGNVWLGEGDDTYSGSKFAETVFGDGGNDSISSDLSNDRLFGGAGDDSLDGGQGADTLTGGSGQDTYIVDSAADVIVESDVEALWDTVKTYVSFTLADDDHIELLQTMDAFGTAPINLTGNALLGQTLAGNNGANMLDGGNDTYADFLWGAGGNDTYIIRSTADGISDTAGADHAQCTVSYALAAGASIEYLETLNAAGTSAINLTGNDLSQRITGNAGANRIAGLGGNDVLVGGNGYDVLAGGANNDTFVFNTALNTMTNRDIISDFNAPTDVIHLENSLAGTFTTLAFGTLNAAFFKANASGVATDLDDRIVYNTATGVLTYDSNGSAAGGAVQFAILTGHPVITAADFLVI